MSIIDTLRAKALQIKNEVLLKANTAFRIGTLFENIVDYLGSLGTMAKVNDVTEQGKKYVRIKDGWEEAQTGGGESSWLIINVTENYIATQTNGNIIINCVGTLTVTLPSTTTALFIIRNSEDGIITIVNEVNGIAGDTISYKNNSFMLAHSGAGKYKTI